MLNQILKYRIANDSTLHKSADFSVFCGNKNYVKHNTFMSDKFVIEYASINFVWTLQEMHVYINTTATIALCHGARDFRWSIVTFHYEDTAP